MDMERPPAPLRAWDALRGRLEVVPRPLLYGIAGVLLLALLAAMAVLPWLLGVDQNDLESLGYPGVFIANFVGTATLFVPVPGLTAAGQALIVALAETHNPWGVAFAGSAGMTLAETTAYAAGRIGRAVREEGDGPVKGRWGRALRRAGAVVDRLMLRWGFLTLLVLSAVPNPLFEFAGITAGAVRMNFWRFMLAVAIGKTMRALMLAFVGGWLFGPTEI
jgi:membrane protein DedA with SNARE-associated domain